MKSTSKILFSAIALSLIIFVSCQPTKQALIVSYNVENLFDTISNSGNDKDFIPEGPKKYDTEKYYTKLENLAKVLSTIDEKQLPDIIGLTEIENRQVVKDLTEQKTLSKGNYHICHFDSPDPRGIDVALIHTPNFKLIKEQIVPVYTDENKRYRTRDILYVKGILQKDTLHLFVNHWKSRSGGAEKTEPRRISSALTLRNVTDSLLSINKNTKIIIMGDFNDNPNNTSLHSALGAGKPDTDSALINIMFPLFDKGLGTHNYRDEWSMLDNFVVSQSIIKGKGLRAVGNGIIFFTRMDLLQNQ